MTKGQGAKEVRKKRTLGERQMKTYQSEPDTSVLKLRYIDASEKIGIATKVDPTHDQIIEFSPSTGRIRNDHRPTIRQFAQEVPRKFGLNDFACLMVSRCRVFRVG